MYMLNGPAIKLFSVLDIDKTQLFSLLKSNITKNMFKKESKRQHAQ